MRKLANATAATMTASLTPVTYSGAGVGFGLLSGASSVLASASSGLAASLAETEPGLGSDAGAAKDAESDGEDIMANKLGCSTGCRV